MIKKVKPPKPVSVLALFTFVVLAGVMFVVLPVVLGLLSVGVGALEAMGSNNISGDFSNIVFGNLLWGFAGVPFAHWFLASLFVVVCTLLFVIITVVVSKKIR
ncbi:MAG: hypothetical protein V1914_04270 [archaeon]